MIPPREALAGAGLLLAPMLLVAVAAGLLVGPLAALGVVLGGAAGAPVALVRVGARWRASYAVALVAAVLAGLAVTGHAWLAGLVTALACVAQVPFTRRARGSAALLPIVAALCSSGVVPRSPLTVTAWLLVGVVVVVVAAPLLGAAAEPEPVPAPAALRHAGVMAVAAGLAMYVALATGIGHGYWMVVTVVVVLQPDPGATRTAARQRVLGTLSGVALAVAAVVVLPTWASLALAGACLLVSSAWALVGNQRSQAAATSAAIVLVASSGLVGPGIGLAATRLLLTAAGAFVAGALAVALLEGEHDASTSPAGQP